MTAPPSQRRQVVLGQGHRILTKDADRSPRRPEGEQHQPHEGCLAGAGRACEELKALWFDGKIKIAEHLRSHAVAQTDVFEPYQRDPRDGAGWPFNAPLTVFRPKYHHRLFHRNSKGRRHDSRSQVRPRLRSRFSASALAGWRGHGPGFCPCRLGDHERDGYCGSGGDRVDRTDNRGPLCWRGTTGEP